MFSTSCIRLGCREEFRASYPTNHNHNYIHEQSHSNVHGEALCLGISLGRPEAAQKAGYHSFRQNYLFRQNFSRTLNLRFQTLDPLDPIFNRDPISSQGIVLKLSPQCEAVPLEWSGVSVGSSPLRFSTGSVGDWLSEPGHPLA